MHVLIFSVYISEYVYVNVSVRVCVYVRARVCVYSIPYYINILVYVHCDCFGCS